jgi:hypothetical protein
MLMKSITLRDKFGTLMFKCKCDKKGFYDITSYDGLGISSILIVDEKNSRTIIKGGK